MRIFLEPPEGTDLVEHIMIYQVLSLRYRLLKVPLPHLITPLPRVEPCNRHIGATHCLDFLHTVELRPGQQLKETQHKKMK